MKGDRQIIQLLNRQLTRELTAVNQYFLHARMYEQWGFERLGDREYHESIDEMKHADSLVKRILMLDGLPNLQDLGKLRIGENPREMLGSDLELERGSQETLKAGITACEAAKDYVSREILEHILDDTEDHVDWIETQLELIDKVGEPNYLQSQMGGDEEGKS
jgi:bacterioferritin